VLYIIITKFPFLCIGFSLATPM